MNDEFDEIEPIEETTPAQLIQRFRVPEEATEPDTEETIWLRVRERLQAQEEETQKTQRIFADMADQKIRDACKDAIEANRRASQYQAMFRISFMFAIAFAIIAFALMFFKPPPLLELFRDLYNLFPGAPQ